MTKEHFLKLGETSQLPKEAPKATDLAALVYTSGTTGNPKGVMLNALQRHQHPGRAQEPAAERSRDLPLFLLLSHTFERTTSYYLASSGYTTAFNRSIANLQADFRQIRPTVLMSVPRVYEMIYAKLQDGLAKKSKFVRYLFDWAVEVGWRRFVRENGLPVESSSRAWLDPFVAGFLEEGRQPAARRLRRPHPPLHLGRRSPQPRRRAHLLRARRAHLSGLRRHRDLPDHLGEQGRPQPPEHRRPRPAQHRGPPRRGRRAPGPRSHSHEGLLEPRGGHQGHLHRGRVAAHAATSGERPHPDGNIRITGPIKEIIVTSTGEKVPPADLESAITSDRLFSQCMVVGDDRPGSSPPSRSSIPHPVQDGLRRARPRSRQARVASGPRLPQGRPQAHQDRHRGLPELRRAASGPLARSTRGTIDNGLLTPTLKMKRNLIRQRYTAEINALYDTLVKR